jgi:hypothetical protein
MHQVRAFGLVTIGIGVSAAVLAGTVKIELPPESAALNPGPGVELANGQCLTCHSAEYITTQPRDKPLAFWKAEVEKMRKVYGAPVPEDQIQPLAEYLARNYGVTNP